VRPINAESIRIAENADITQHRIAYAEDIDGLPLDEEALLELDEIYKDKLVDSWYMLFGGRNGYINTRRLRSKDTD
jgi:hypothetical protein